MALARSGGRKHRIRYIGGGYYDISWSYEVKYKGSRLLWYRSFTRTTDKRGAEKFAKKWGCKMPEVPQ